MYLSLSVFLMYRLGHFRVCVCDAGVISLVLTPPFLFVLFLLFSILDRGASVLTLSLFLSLFHFQKADIVMMMMKEVV